MSIRTPERVSKARAGVTEKNIRDWFLRLNNYIEENNLQEMMRDPSRIFNCDETCIRLCPDTGKVLGMRGWKNIYEVAPGPEKSTLTFLGTFGATGVNVTPMIIFPYVRLPRDIAQSVPSEFFMATTDSGWMKSETFYEYMANAFNPWLEEQNIIKPVIMFVDGHRTHLSMQISKFCEDNHIVLYLLPPNTTHMLQPADVGAFKPLKDFWRQEVIDFQRSNPNLVVKRRDVAPLLSKVLQKIPSSAIVNGFRATGLYPCDPNAIDYSKCLEVRIENEDGDLIEEVGELVDYQQALKVVDSLMTQNNAAKCKRKEDCGEILQEMYNQLLERASMQRKHYPTTKQGEVIDIGENSLIEIEENSSLGPIQYSGETTVQPEN